MSDTLDLAAIEARRRDALEWWSLMLSRDIVEKDVPALIARVRELEAALADTVKAHNDVFNLWETASGEAAAAEARVRELEAEREA